MRKITVNLKPDFTANAIFPAMQSLNCIEGVKAVNYDKGNPLQMEIDVHEEVANDKGTVTKINPEAVLKAVRAKQGPHIVGAEFKPS